MEWRPNKWIAAVLGLLLQSLGFLYVASVRWAVIYFLASILITVSEIALRSAFSTSWLQYFSFNYVLMVVAAVHAYRIAAYGHVHLSRPWYSKWYGITAIFLGPVSVIVLIRSFLLEPFRFPSASMLPTIQRGALLVAQKWGYGNYGTYGISLLRTSITAEIRRGDIVIFDFPHDPSIRYAKRIIGTPADVIEIRGKQLKINGEPVKAGKSSSPQHFPDKDEMSYVAKSEILSETEYTVAYTKNTSDRNITVTVPPENYFVLGDNRDHSNDSRYWGFVPARNIVGKVIYINQ